MRDRISYSDLTREQQRLLTRLYGGGTLRGQDEDIVDSLSLRGLVTGGDLTDLGRQICLEALPQLRERLGGSIRKLYPEPSNS